MNIQPYTYTHTVNKNRTVRNQNTGNISVNIKKSPDKDCVSFGAVSFSRLIKSHDPELNDLSKIVKNDLVYALDQTVAWLSNYTEMSIKSWNKISEIIERKNKENLHLPEIHSLDISAQLADSRIIQSPEDISKTSFIKWNEISEHLQKKGFNLVLFDVEVTPVKNLSIKSNSNKTLTFTFRNDDNAELFYNKTIIEEDIVLKDINDISEESIQDIAKECNAKKAIVWDRQIITIPYSIQNAFNLPNETPVAIEGIKITPEDLGHKGRKSMQDLKKIIDAVLEDSNNKDIEKITYVKYLKEKYSK